MLAPDEQRLASPQAWTGLEAEIGTGLPEDCKAVVDAYAPMQINGRLGFVHEFGLWLNFWMLLVIFSSCRFGSGRSSGGRGV
ncbi:hypothetical protein ACFV0O_27215 [Kitasatospora sp. NPDC059577]|uniref:hypothetical protein n=1 Tax=unclassified Kitasatospora TaxID=2633591 RepID=UPI00369A93C6